MGYGWLAGDWREDHQTTKMVQMIEPVSEGVMQFFCQTIILYMIAGPADSKESENFIDLSSLAFDESLSSKVLYLSLLFSSLLTVCSSLARVENYQSRDEISIIVYLDFSFRKKTRRTETSFIQIPENQPDDHLQVCFPRLHHVHGD